MPDYYRILGVAPTADPAILRRAFRELSKQYHPDTTTLPAEEATRKFQALQTAYQVLNDPEARRRYDLRRIPAAVAVPRTPQPARAPVAANAYLDAKDRALSPGELFALFLLALTFLLSLVLAIGLGLARGEALLKAPSWLQPAATVTAPDPAGEPTPVSAEPATPASAAAPMADAVADLPTAPAVESIHLPDSSL
jgi:hypothetical protein